MESNKSTKKNTKEGKLKIMENKMRELDFEPPPVSNISWADYKEAMLSNVVLHIGRTPVCKTRLKDIKLTVGMSENFPLEISEILDVFDMILPEKKVNRIREIFSMKLPPGFPVSMDIPIVPTVNANISFLSAQVGCPELSIDESLFSVPDSFELVNKI